MSAHVRQFKRLIIDAALLPALVLAALAGVLLWQVLYLQDLNDQEKQADTVQARIARQERLLEDGDFGLRGFLLSGDERQLAPLQEAQHQLPPATQALREILAGDPPQLERVDRMVGLEAGYWAHAAHAVAERRAGRTGQVVSQVERSGTILDDIRQQIRAMEDEEEARRSTRNIDARQVTQRTVVFGGVLALALMSVVALSAVRQMRRAAEIFGGAVRARDEFISVASHELKTPLTSLQLQVQLLAREVGRDAEAPGGEGPARRLAIIEQSTRRLAGLVNRLLDVSRLGAGSLELSRERIDLADLAGECLARQRDRIEASGVQVSLTAAPVVGDWDRLRVESVVSNLLENALKYGEGRPVALRVDRDGGMARLAVTDHGIGIARENQDRIFERFQRAVGDRIFEGLGVGLWLVRAIVEEHGGTVAVESKPGQGSTFTVLLPCAGDEQADPVAAPASR